MFDVTLFQRLQFFLQLYTKQFSTWQFLIGRGDVAQYSVLRESEVVLSSRGEIEFEN